MQLCSNRPEGFGPHSSLHPSLPTTCFQDIIVVPLATWIYFIAVIATLPYAFLAARRSFGGTSIDREKSGHTRRKLWRTILFVLYCFFIIALIAMISLEIARLVDARLGIGLLPFTYAGTLVALVLHVLVHRRAPSGSVIVKGINAVYWLLLAAVFAIKVATYVKEGVHSRDSRAPVDKYKVSDEVTDVAVMIFVVVVLAILELVD